VDCQPLMAVSHVAHIPVGYRIVEDKKLRADLVFDESILNDYRARVVWLSPNDWTGAGGFRYGNVSFAFPWRTVIEGRRCFWVESIAYGIEACRILVTSTDWSGVLRPYDPVRGDGPWWVDPEGNHFWNGNYCLEVMTEDDVSLELATGLSFVGHHANRCSIDPYGCPDLGKSDRQGGAEFLATLVSRYQSLHLPSVLYTYGDGHQSVSGSVGAALNTLMHACARLEVPGPGIVAGDPQAPALARALLGAMYRDPTADRAQLARLFSCNKCLVEAVANVIVSAWDDDQAEVIQQELAEWTN
jgi:hypothetical protein